MTLTIGQQLKAEREEQRLTLEKVFEATRIRVQYLQALEADDLSVMPSPVQARGYLRNYAEYLGLDVDQMLNGLRDLTVQQASKEIIGPADPTLSATKQASEVVDTVPIIPPPPEPAEVIQEKPTYSEEVTIPIKPKSTRRKKADGNGGQATPAAEPTTRRRGRKKVEPIVETPPNISEEISVPVETTRPPSTAEEAVAPAETAPKPDAIEAQTELVGEAPIPSQQDASEQTEVSDTLWQAWLSRLGSVLAARSKRKTLTPKELPVVEREPVVEVTEPEGSPDVGIHQRPFENSNEIFKEIGRELRTRRELLSLHFDEVERNTHVKAHYLDALERGALDELPSTVQTRGMLSNYATFLDLDVDMLLLRFADALQARHRERNPQKPVRTPGQPIIPNMPPVRGFIAGDMIFGVSMAILLVGFAIWGVSRVMTIQSQREVKPTAPSISDVLLASPNPSSTTATATFLPVESFPGEATVTVEIPTQNVNAAVQLNLVAVERTYMRVTVDGEIVFDGRVVPGNAYPFEGENQIEVLVGSGAAIRTVYNGRDLGLMGTFGQVVNNIYSGTEVLTPTALPSATATITLTPTTTVPPTATSRFTETPVPSATAVP